MTYDEALGMGAEWTGTRREVAAMADRRVMPVEPDQRHGVPGARSIDHIGLTLPDLDQGIRFFVDVLGGEHIYTAGPFASPDSDWMSINVGVAARATLRLAMIRLGATLNLELLEYGIPGDQPESEWPTNSAPGAAHLCLYVDDLPSALEYMRRTDGVTVLGSPTTVGGDIGAGSPNAGVTWVYCVAPWGLVIELITYPNGMAYEAEPGARLVGPAPAWRTQG